MTRRAYLGKLGVFAETHGWAPRTSQRPTDLPTVTMARPFSTSTLLTAELLDGAGSFRVCLRLGEKP